MPLPEYGRWWAEESEDSWDLYYSGTNDPDAVVHGLKVLKAPKHGTPYAEYWPNTTDAAYIITALNAFGGQPKSMSAEDVDKYMNEVLASGMLMGVFSMQEIMKYEVVMDDDGQATNQHYVWFPVLKSRYRVTIEMDPE